ncbi:MAG: hypothetical protein IVW55_00415 [Chloroflexi bacterium]|nr:hypothetical protein [Chloroflexota bacterium]
MKTNKASSSERPLSEWLTEEEMLQRTGISSWQLQRWHREVFAWSNEPLFEQIRIGHRMVTFYNPECVSIARRLLEMKKEGLRDFDAWLWQLWLDGYPINMRAYCLKVIEGAQEEVQSLDESGVLYSDQPLADQLGLRSPASDSLLELAYKRVYDKDKDYVNALITWLLHVAAEKEPPIEWDYQEEYDYDVPEELRYPSIGELFARAAGAPEEWAQPVPLRELMSIRAGREALARATEDQWRQVREDCRVIADSFTAWQHMYITYKRAKQAVKEGLFVGDVTVVATMGKAMRLVPVRVISKLYSDRFVRAVLAGYLLRVRMSDRAGNVESVMASLQTLAVTVGVATDPA